MNNIRIQKSVIFQLAATTVFTLLLGIAYYWFTRPQGSTVFLSLLPSLPQKQDLSFFAQWLGWFPSFIHVFAFSILTYLALGRRHRLFACILWSAINILFELGQALPAGLVLLLPDFFNIRIYFANGVFDPLDLAACVIGAWVAWMVLKGRFLDYDGEQVGIENISVTPSSTSFRSREVSQ